MSGFEFKPSVNDGKCVGSNKRSISELREKTESQLEKASGALLDLGLDSYDKRMLADRLNTEANAEYAKENKANSKYQDEFDTYIPDFVIADAIPLIISGKTAVQAIKESSSKNNCDPAILKKVKDRKHSATSISNAVMQHKEVIEDNNGNITALLKATTPADLLNLLKKQVNQKTDKQIIQQLRSEVKQLKSENLELKLQIADLSNSDSSGKPTAQAKRDQAKILREEGKLKDVEIMKKLKIAPSTYKNWKSKDG